MANTTVRTVRDRVARQVAFVDSAYTMTSEDSLVLGATAGGAFSVTLPSAASCFPGQTFEFKKTDSSANDMTVARAGTDTIDGATSKVLGAQYDSLLLVSDGTSKFYVMGTPVLNT